MRVKSSYGPGIQSSDEGSLSFFLNFPIQPSFSYGNHVQCHSLMHVSSSSKSCCWTKPIKGCSPSSSAFSSVFILFLLAATLSNKLLLGFLGSCYLRLAFESWISNISGKSQWIHSERERLSFIIIHMAFMIAHGFLWVLIIVNSASGCAILERKKKKNRGAGIWKRS